MRAPPSDAYPPHEVFPRGLATATIGSAEPAMSARRDTRQDTSGQDIPEEDGSEVAV